MELNNEYVLDIGPGNNSIISRIRTTIPENMREYRYFYGGSPKYRNEDVNEDIQIEGYKVIATSIEKTNQNKLRLSLIFHDPNQNDAKTFQEEYISREDFNTFIDSEGRIYPYNPENPQVDDTIGYSFNYSDDDDIPLTGFLVFSLNQFLENLQAQDPQAQDHQAENPQLGDEGVDMSGGELKTRKRKLSRRKKRKLSQRKKKRTKSKKN